MTAVLPVPNPSDHNWIRTTGSAPSRAGSSGRCSRGPRTSTSLLGTELRDLMRGADWREFDVLPGVIVPLSPEEAEAEFLKRYAELTA